MFCYLERFRLCSLVWTVKDLNNFFIIEFNWMRCASFYYQFRNMLCQTRSTFLVLLLKWTFNIKCVLNVMAKNCILQFQWVVNGIVVCQIIQCFCHKELIFVFPIFNILIIYKFNETKFIYSYLVYIYSVLTK